MKIKRSYVKIKKLNYNEILYLISYGLYIFCAIISTSFYSKYFQGMLYKLTLGVCVGVLIVNESTKVKYSVKRLAGLLVAVFLFGVILRVSSGTSAWLSACLILYIYCGYNIDFKIIAKFTVWWSMLIVFFVIFSAQKGLILNYTSYDHERLREYLGFRYALYPATYLFNATMLIVYLLKDRLNIVVAGILIYINYYIFDKTDSRMVFALSTLILVFLCLGKKWISNILSKKKVAFVCILSYVISAVISFGLTITYNPSIDWMWQLNKFFGNRLRLGQISLEKYGINLLGKNIDWIGNGLDLQGNKTSGVYLWVDSLYIQIMQHFGIIFFCVFLLLITYALYKMYNSEDYYLMLILTIIAIHCIIDDLSIYLYFNTFWIPIGYYLLQGIRRKLDVNSKS